MLTLIDLIVKFLQDVTKKGIRDCGGIHRLCFNFKLKLGKGIWPNVARILQRKYSYIAFSLLV